jgi:hypothetical protein
MRLPRSYFKLEAVWILALSLAPLLLGLLLFILVRFLSWKTYVHWNH